MTHSTGPCEEEEGGAAGGRSDEGCWEENCFLWAMSWGHLMEENMWTLIELYHLYQSISNQEHVDL